MRGLYFSSVGLLSLVMGIGSAAQAQSTAPADQAESVGVEDIVVTAQRREESLQSVPISVTALSANTLARSNLVSSTQLDVVTPGLVTTSVQGSAQVYIRGVGGQSTTVGTESVVAQYVNGVYRASTTGSVFTLNNIERIEVLRGPQGTLFGRNATGGVIQVITKKPQYTPTMSASLAYGNYQTLEGAAYASTGLSDNVAISLAVAGQNQGKGFGRDLARNKKMNYNNDLTGRAELLFEPSDATSIRLAADFDRQTTNLSMGRNVIPGGRTITGGPPAASGYDTNTSQPTLAKNKTWSISQELDSDLGFANFRSITAYNKYHFLQTYDQDTTPALITDVATGRFERTFQQEFLLNGDLDRLNWTVGAFLFDFKARGIVTTFTGANAAGNVSRDATTDISSYAGYGQGTYSLTDSLKLTAGVRYTKDKSKLNGSNISGVGGPAPAGTILLTVNNRVLKNSKVTYRASIDYKASDNALLYVSYNRGYKSGQYNTTSIAQLPTNPETLDAIEGGFKTNFFDKRVRFNVSAFHYSYKDLQLSIVAPQPIGIQTLNATKAKLKGLEAELITVPPVPVGRLQLGANLSVLDAKYGKFPNAPISILRPYTSLPAGVIAPPAGVGSCPATSAATGGASTCQFDATGQRMIRAPKWTIGLNWDYRIPVGSGEFGVSGNFYHNDGFYWEVSNRLKQKPYDVLNGQISYEFKDMGLTLRAYVRNLTDSRYYATLTEQSLGDVGALMPPRTYGVGVKYSF